MKTIKKINDELDKKIPDITNEVKNKVDWEQIKLNNAPKKATKFNFKLALASVCSVLVLSLAIVLPFQLGDKNSPPSHLNDNINQVAYTVVLDVNPRMRFDVNEKNIILHQTPLNKDGVVLLYKNNVVGLDLNTATSNILKEIDKDGLLSTTIKLSIADTKGNQLLDKETNMSKIIQDLFTKPIDITYLSDEDLDLLEEYYENNKISEYEANFIKEFQNKLKIIANEKIDQIEKIIVDLEPYAKDIEQAITDFNKVIETEIKDFSNKYNYDTELNWLKLTYDSIYDFTNELKEHKEELIESLEEISEENDDYNELLEDLFELVKDELFEEND